MQFGNIPRVDLIGSGRAEFGFHMGWTRCLIATVADFTNAPQDAVYRRDRAVIAAFVKQSRVDVRYTAVNKTHLVDRI